MKASERIFLTADRERAVPEGHKEAAFLYAAPGDEIPDTAAAQLGLVDGGAPRAKRAAKGEDKQSEAGADKAAKGAAKG